MNRHYLLINIALNRAGILIRDLFCGSDKHSEDSADGGHPIQETARSIRPQCKIRRRTLPGYALCLSAAVRTIIFASSVAIVQAAVITGADHAFDASLPDFNKYNLDMSLDAIPASPPTSGYLYCRWGVLVGQSDPSVGSEFGRVLNFSYLTQPPYSPASKDLIVCASSSPQVRNIPSFPGPLPLSSQLYDWHAPVGTGLGEVKISSPQANLSYYLFRKLHFSPVLFEWLSPEIQLRLKADTRKLIIMVHGWNRVRDYDAYDGEEFAALGAAIRSQIASDPTWKLAGYHWEADADTGPAILSAPLFRDWGAINGAEAAEIGHQHGLHLGQVLLNNYPNLTSIQFIAHSAGSWCARSAAKYLLQRNANITVQVTLLDPYIPEAAKVIGVGNTSLTVERMNELGGLSPKAYLLENYYSQDLETHFGTENNFTWRQGDVSNMPVDWAKIGPNGAGLVFYYASHSGPIQYYADTVVSSADVNQPFPIGLIGAPYQNNLQQRGWWRSLFMNEITIDQPPQSISSAVQGQSVSFTVHAISRREQLGYPSLGLPISYRWERLQGDGEWSTAYGSGGASTYTTVPLAPGDKGQYRVVVNNGTGDIASMFTLNVNTLAGSPQISIASPSSGNSVSTTTVINATVSDAVSKVRFYVDGALLATVTTAPFAWNWDTTISTNGTHILTAEGYGGLVETLLGISAPVSVTVNNVSAIPVDSDGNGSSPTATQLTTAQLATGYISSPTDVDWFKTRLSS